MKAYVARFSGLSITTADWLSHFWLYWNAFPQKAELYKQVNWDAWLYGEGLTLPVDMNFDTTLADKCYDLASRWNSRPEDTTTFSTDDISTFSSTQVGLFLSTLIDYEPFDERVINRLNECYGLQSSGNSEIRLRWYKLALKAGFFSNQAAEVGNLSQTCNIPSV